MKTTWWRWQGAGEYPFVQFKIREVDDFEEALLDNLIAFRLLSGRRLKSGRWLGPSAYLAVETGEGVVTLAVGGRAVCVPCGREPRLRKVSQILLDLGLKIVERSTPVGRA